MAKMSIPTIPPELLKSYSLPGSIVFIGIVWLISIFRPPQVEAKSAKEILQYDGTTFEGLVKDFKDIKSEVKEINKTVTSLDAKLSYREDAHTAVETSHTRSIEWFRSQIEAINIKLGLIPNSEKP